MISWEYCQNLVAYRRIQFGNILNLFTGVYVGQYTSLLLFARALFILSPNITQ